MEQTLKPVIGEDFQQAADEDEDIDEDEGEDEVDGTAFCIDALQSDITAMLIQIFELNDHQTIDCRCRFL